MLLWLPLFPLTLLSILILFTQKVLLSIVDPWDVRVASVDPVGLAERRGVSLSISPPQQSNKPEESVSPGRIVRTPSPWYKPAHSNVLEQLSADGAGVETSSGEPTWVDPWHSSR